MLPLSLLSAGQMLLVTFYLSLEKTGHTKALPNSTTKYTSRWRYDAAASLPWRDFILLTVCPATAASYSHWGHLWFLYQTAVVYQALFSCRDWKKLLLISAPAETVTSSCTVQREPSAWRPSLRTTFSGSTTEGRSSRKGPCCWLPAASSPLCTGNIHRLRVKWRTPVITQEELLWRSYVSKLSVCTVRKFDMKIKQFLQLTISFFFSLQWGHREEARGF